MEGFEPLHAMEEDAIFTKDKEGQGAMHQTCYFDPATMPDYQVPEGKVLVVNQENGRITLEDRNSLWHDIEND